MDLGFQQIRIKDKSVPMGQEQAKQKQHIADNFVIVRTVSPGEYLVRRKKKGDQLLLRLLTFYLEEEMTGYIRLLEKRKKIKNPHLLELVEHTRISQQNMCSSTFKIRTVVQYPFKTLKDEILERSAPVNRRYFNEDELWSILYSCCHALYSLYINKFYHECLNVDQIFIDTGGLVKIADSILVSTTKNHLALMNEGGSELDVRYIAPELVNLVEDNNFYYYEKEKSDVFILAMIALEIGNLTPVSYYDRNTKKFNFDAYIPAIEQLRSRYSLQFCEILQKMLTMDFKERPRLQEIIESIEQRTVYTGSSGNTSFMTNNPDQRKSRLSRERVATNANQSNHKQLRTWQKPLVSDAIVKAHPLQTFDLNFKKELAPAAGVYNSLPSSAMHSYELNRAAPPPLPSYSQNIEISPTKRYEPKQAQKRLFGEFKLETWSFDAIIKDIEKKNQNKSNYTPYQELIGLTTDKKDSNGPTFHFGKKESSNPVQKPNISVRFSSGVPSSNTSLSNLLQPTLEVSREGVPQTEKEALQLRKFSELKFGGIELNTQKIINQEEKTPQVTHIQKSAEREVKRELITPIAVEQGSIQKAARSIGNSSPSLKESEAAVETQFIIQETPHGRYEGFVSKGKRNGVGRLVYNEGGFYQGKWKDGQMDGYGKLYYPNGSVAYEGHWSNSQFNGQGRIYNDYPDESHQDEGIDYIDFDTIGERWETYEGGFLNDQKNGKGTVHFINGEKFSGLFAKDRAEGEGLFYKKDGDVVRGIWRDNRFVGVA